MFLFVEDSLLRDNRIYIDLAHKLLDDVGGDFYNAYNKSTFISSVLSSIIYKEIFSFRNIFDLLPYYRYKEIQNPKDIMKDYHMYNDIIMNELKAGTEDSREALMNLMIQYFSNQTIREKFFSSHLRKFPF